jgi:hypothetical protein
MLHLTKSVDTVAHDQVYNWLTSTATSTLIVLAKEARGKTGQSDFDKAQGVLLLWRKLTGSSARDEDLARLNELANSIPNPD